MARVNRRSVATRPAESSEAEEITAEMEVPVELEVPEPEAPLYARGDGITTEKPALPSELNPAAGEVSQPRGGRLENEDAEPSNSFRLLPGTTGLTSVATTESNSLALKTTSNA